MPSVVLNGQTLRLQAGSLIGKGGEADVYRLDPKTVLKLYKKPDDPDYVGNPTAQQGARERILEHQQKLPQFPKGLPAEVVAPLALAYDKVGGKVVGYTMPFVSNMEVLMRLGDRQYREASGIDANQVIATFTHLHRVVQGVHKQRTVLGDFNDLNVLVNATDLRVVDADSMQFGGFHTRTFTSRFVDPLVCLPNRLVLARPHTEDSDWYAYFIMLIQSLLHVGPYGGVHRPKTGKRLQHDDRVLQRVTVFDGNVIYPKPALPLSVLPDDVLAHMHAVFETDRRGEFPLRLLENLRWTTCDQCGLSHARAICPRCAATAGVVKQVVTVHGTVTAERVFKTRGRLLHVVYQGNTLRYIYHDNGVFYREGDRQVLKGDLAAGLRLRIQGNNTLISQGNKLFVLSDTGVNRQLATDTYRHTLPVFDANSRHLFYLTDGQLAKDEPLAPKYLNAIVPGQTLIWTGEKFGFGFYQAGALVRAFVYNTAGHFNDQVGIRALPGQLIDATCVFSDELAWFLVISQEQGVIVHRCFVVDKQGKLLAEASANDGEDTWLGSGIRGHLALGHSLYAATDDGIVRVGLSNGAVVEESKFPDTEPYVTTHTQLVQGPNGIYAVSNQDITLLKIK